MLTMKLIRIKGKNWLQYIFFTMKFSLPYYKIITCLYGKILKEKEYIEKFTNSTLMKISHVLFFGHNICPVLLKYVIQCNYEVLIKATLRAVQHSIM